MGQVLRTEQMWKAGFLSSPEPDESILQEAISNALDALQRNVEAKQSRYKDKVIPHVLAMNTYWYMYMRTRGSELAKLVGEETMKKKYKTRAEEAAYYYQTQAWGPLVKLLEREEESSTIGEGAAVARGKMERFMREFNENMRRHQTNYSIPDADLREQIKEAVEKLVVPAYAGFLHSYSGVMQGRSFLPPDSIQELLGRLFGVEDIKPGRKNVVEGEGGITNVKRREFRNRREEEEKVEEEEVRVERRGSFGRTDERGSFGRKEELGSFRRKDERGSFGRKEENERFERKERGSFGRKQEMNGGRKDFENKEEEKPLETLGMLIGKRGGSFERKEGRREGRGSIGSMEELGGGGGSFGRRGGKEAGTQKFGKTELGSFGRSEERREEEEEEDNIDTREKNAESARSSGRREFRNQGKGAIKTTVEVEVEKPYLRRREEEHNNIETREEKKGGARSVGRREISNKREGERKTTMAAEKPYFRRREEEEQNNIEMTEEKEERVRRRGRREFRNQEEGEVKLTMEAEKPYFRRREFHKREEMRKNDEEENKEGKEWNKALVEGGMTNFGRRRFKNQLEEGSVPLINHLVT